MAIQRTIRNPKIFPTNPYTHQEAEIEEVADQLASLAAGTQVGIQFQDEGLSEGTQGLIDTVDFAGAGVTAVASGSKLTVTVTATGGGGEPADLFLLMGA